MNEVVRQIIWQIGLKLHAIRSVLEATAFSAMCLQKLKVGAELYKK